jgi:hypothetical protein
MIGMIVIYGVLAYLVTPRRHELRVRLLLGAQLELPKCVLVCGRRTTGIDHRENQSAPRRPIAGPR